LGSLSSNKQGTIGGRTHLFYKGVKSSQTARVVWTIISALLAARLVFPLFEGNRQNVY